MHTEGHDMGKDALGNTQPAAQGPKIDPEHPGYETTDVRVTGIAVFLAGLFGTVLIFFVLCYGMGMLINNGLKKYDGPPSKWSIAAGHVPEGKGQDLTSNAEIEQKQLAQITSEFPRPQLESDDGNQDTADLHAREDLLLEHYSTVDGEPGTIRIPIERAMELIAQQGLPVAAPSSAAGETLAHAAPPVVHAPLTDGFARTGYELTEMQAREQKMESEKAESAEK
ncbi:MAG TPA: hypothetical protein VG714_06065 [Acidobacteriaceae bacterium]|nr:hypothetical protein [Acidobacteriaceae bacterium]